MAKTFLQLTDSIKKECRIKASDDLDDWVKDVINQEYEMLCENAEYPQLLVPFATVAITSDAQSVFALPVGYRKMTTVEFALDTLNPAWRPLTRKNGFTPS